MIKFFYSLIPVGFRAISMSFLSFLSQKTYPGEFLKPEVILSRSYLRKCKIWPGPPSIINLSFFKNAIKSEPLGVRDWYFQDFHISMVSTTGKNFKKELPNEAFFLLVTLAIINVKMSFTHSQSSSCQGNIFLHQNHATYWSKL